MIDRTAIVAAYRAEHPTTAVLCRRFGCSPWVITSALRAVGIKRRGGPRPRVEIPAPKPVLQFPRIAPWPEFRKESPWYGASLRSS